MFSPQIWLKSLYCSQSMVLTVRDYHREAAPLYGFTYKVLPKTKISTCTCKQHYPTSPLDGDCVLACRIHHALRFKTKQSIIILFCWSTNREIRAQTAPLEWTFIRIIDKHEERGLNLKLTTQVHLFLVLTVSLKTGCLPGYEQGRG